MNLNHTVKVVGSVLLSAVMAGSMMPVTVFAQSNDENPTEKTETVYSVLNSDGSISDTIVSSWLHDEDGINNIKETLNLKNVKNIKTSEKPSKDGNTYTWNAKGNDVYYEGDGTQQLPVSVKIRYELDGQEVSAKDIDGKSGHLKLTISFTNNKSETKTINGKSIIIHPSFLAGGMLNMSTGNFTNVKCDAGKIVNDGSNEILAFANIPGLNETLTSAGLDKVNDQLGISDDVVVEADVNDFDLGSIMIGMTNEIDLSEELGSIDSVSELTDGIDQLMDADEQLIDGSKQLYDGTTQLKEQASPLTSASGQVRELSAGAIQLNDGVKSLQTGLTAYTAGVSSLDAGVSQLYGIPQGAATISSGMTTKGKSGFSMVEASATLKAGLNQLNSELASTSADESYKALSEKLSEAQAGIKSLEDKVLTPTKNELDNLSSSLGKATSSLEALQKLADNLQTVEDSITKDKETVTKDNEIVTKNNAKINQVTDAKGKLKNSIDTLSNTISQLETAKSQLTNSVNTAQAQSTEENPVDYSAVNTQISELDGQITTLKDQLKTLEDKYAAMDDTEMDSLDELTSINDNIKTINAILGTVTSSKDELTKTLEDANASVTKLQGYMDAAKNGLSDMQALLNSTKGDVSKMQALIPTLQRSVDQLTKLADGVDTGVQQVNSGVATLVSQSQAGIDKVKAGTSQLTANNATLNGGAAQLSEATGTLAGQSGTFNEMADGLDTLGTAFETLNDGAKQLYDGNVQFKSEGLDQLKEKVDLGVGELETLEKIMDEIDSMNKEYSSYSGAPEGATVTSRYVFRTKEESSK